MRATLKTFLPGSLPGVGFLPQAPLTSCSQDTLLRPAPPPVAASHNGGLSGAFSWPRRGSLPPLAATPPTRSLLDFGPEAKRSSGDLLGGWRGEAGVSKPLGLWGTPGNTVGRLFLSVAPAGPSGYGSARFCEAWAYLGNILLPCILPKAQLGFGGPLTFSSTFVLRLRTQGSGH